MTKVVIAEATKTKAALQQEERTHRLLQLHTSQASNCYTIKETFSKKHKG
jgi:hypothetical protein